MSANRPHVKIAPSILSSDFARLGDQVAEAEAAGADYIHVDVMDGHFVPNITIGAPVVAAIHKRNSTPLDVHLMIESPEKYIADFARAGSAIITVHAESCPHLHRVLQLIRESGVRAGVALNPSTPIGNLEHVLADADLILIMTVNPGFGGQAFIPRLLGKISALRQRLDELHLPAELEVDGGITADTAPRVVAAGARVLVAGSAVFSVHHTVAEGISRIRDGIAAMPA
jgi:ribulose-phosphate 3-epimerase